jgi:uncharacterized repeat protein (TIGR01451 family)
MDKCTRSLRGRLTLVGRASRLTQQFAGAVAMKMRIGRVLIRPILIVSIVALSVVGPPNTSSTPASTAYAANGDLLRTLAVPSGADCGGGTETAVTAIAGRMTGITAKNNLLAVACLANSVPSNTTSIRTIYFLDPLSGPSANPTNPDSTTIVKSVTTLTNLPSTFLGWGALTVRIDQGDIAGCSNTSDGKHAVYKIDISPFTAVTDGTATKLWDLPDSASTCFGLAWDPGDNSFYQSVEGSTTINHYAEKPNSSGAPVLLGTLPGTGSTITIPPGSDGAGTPCQATGLAIAGASLFIGCKSTTTVLQLNKDPFTSTVLASLNIASGHQPYGMGCDPGTFSNMDSMWAKDKVDNKVYAFQLPNFTCGYATPDPASGNAVPLPAQCAGNIPGTNTPYPKTDTTDADQDGALDCWEANGIDFDGDGTIDYQLPGSGAANRFRKDIYLELDYMDANPNLLPAINDVIQAFNTAPVDCTTATPPICKGVRLFVQGAGAGGEDEQINEPDLKKDFLAFQPGTEPITSTTNQVDFDVIKNRKFGTLAERTTSASNPVPWKRLNAKRMVFRYAVVGRLLLNATPPSFNTISGLSEVFGNDLVVTLAGWGSTASPPAKGTVNGTLMHELGHTLNLRHGSQDNTNCKPEHLSVMSYSRQIDNNPIPGRSLTYARRYASLPASPSDALPPLNETGPTGMNEPTGILSGLDAVTMADVKTRLTGDGEKVAYGVTSKSGAVKVFVVDAAGPINWNGDADTTDSNVSADVNRLGGSCDGKDAVSGQQLSVLNVRDEWSSLAYNFQDSIEFGDGVVASKCTGGVPGVVVTCGKDRFTNATETIGDKTFTRDLKDVKEITLRKEEDGLENITENSAPVLKLTMTDSPTGTTSDPAKVGQELIYTIKVENQGPKAGTKVTVTDTLPPSTSVTFVSATYSNPSSNPTSGSCPAPASGPPSANRQMTCMLGDGNLEVGKTATVIVVVKPKKAETLTNRVNVMSDPDVSVAQGTAVEETIVKTGGP